MARPPVPTLLSKLKLRDVQASVCVRVVRKWVFTGRNENGPILHVDLVLADKEGAVMYAEIPKDEVQDKSALVEPGKVYTISRFRVRNSKHSYMPVRGALMIEFTCYTRVVPEDVPVHKFPQFVYTIVPFTQVRQHVRDHPNFIDVIGVIIKIQQPVSTRLPGQSTSTLTRDIIIKDLEGKELRVTIWGTRSTTFCVTSVYNEQNPKAVVCLFVGCVPKEFQKVSYVTGNNACHWYFNPAIPEAQPYYTKFQDQQLSIDLPPLSPTQVEDDEEIIIEHKTLAELNAIDPFNFPTSGFHCTVAIVAVPEDDSWWYLGCTGCKKSSPDQVGGAPWCVDCESSNFMPRYKLTFTAADDTAQGQFFCFDTIGRQVVRRSCESLFQLRTGAGAVPPGLAAIIGNRYTFAVGLTSESYHSKGTRVYHITCIMEDFQKRVSGPKLLTMDESGKAPPASGTLLVSPPTVVTVGTPTSSSLVVNAPPIESPTPTKSAVLPSGGHITPLQTQTIHDQSTSSKSLEQLPSVHTLPPHKLTDSVKLAVEVEKRNARRKLFHEQSTYEEDPEALSDFTQKDSHQLHDKALPDQEDSGKQEEHCQDLQDVRLKRPKTQDAKSHGKSTGRRSSSGIQKN